MVDETTDTGQSRRKFIKTSAAVGMAAAGVTASVGGATAQQESLNLDTSSLNVNQQTGKVSGLINLSNVSADVIDNITVQNVNVELLTTQGDEVIDLTVKKVVQTGGGDVVKVIVNDVINNVDVLNDSNVSVEVSVLSDSGDLVQQATTDSVSL